MSSVLDCIARLARAGKITDQQARDAKDLYGKVLSDDLLQSMDRSEAEAHAALKTAEILRENARAAKRELARNVNNYIAGSNRLRAHPDGPLAGFIGMFDRDIRNRAGDRVNVSSLETEVYRPQIAAKMHSFDAAYRSTMAGLRQDTNGIRNTIKELFGVRTGDSQASHAAKGWESATTWGTERAKAFGRNFAVSDEWRLPQFWDTKRVNKFTAATFKADLKAAIDGGALRVLDDNGATVTDEVKREAIIDKAINDIRMDQGRRTGPSSVFKEETRTFQFNKGEAGANGYLKLMDKYGPGQGGYFNMMQGHAEKMARELALMHVFGPSYRGMSQKLLDDAIRLNAERALTAPPKGMGGKIGDFLLRPLESATAARHLQMYMTGQLSGAESELMAGIFQGTRSFLTATNMGSAIVTAIPADTVNWAMAASYRGLSSGRLAQMIADHFANDTPDKEAFATRLGIVAHAASRIALGTKQYGDDLLSGPVLSTMKGLADTVIRAQGLHAWDQAINRSFTMEFLAALGDRAGKSFGELDAPFASFLKDYGFTEADWAKLSAADHIAMGPARFLRPDSLEDALRFKLMSAIGDEKQFAYVAGGSNRVRAATRGGAQAGTLPGELARSVFLFKQFPLTLMSTHGIRSVQGAANGQWGQIAQLGLFMTFAGALALQSREVLQGKDPRAMNNGDFWAAAAFQGGALGIYGDFLKSGFSRSDTSLTETLMGPLAEIPSAIGRLTSQTYRAAQDGAPTSYGAELAKDFQKFTPGSTLWYSRLLANRFLFDQVRMAVDPNYADAFGRERDKMQAQYGQDFWWQRGQTAPDRAPQFSTSP